MHRESVVAFCGGLLGLLVLGALFASCVRPGEERSSATITRSRHRTTGHELADPLPPPVDASVEVAAETESTEPAASGVPDDREALEVLEGRVSYYADRFEGRSTASGEPYRARELTAASRDLPFGTIVRVVRVDTGASVVVRVNDRGPFGDRGRILDLSRAAAEALDMIRAGVIEVRAEILERGTGRRASP